MKTIEIEEMTPRRFYEEFIEAGKLTSSPYFQNSEKESNIIIEKLYLQLPVDSIVLLPKYDVDFSYTVLSGNAMVNALADFYAGKLKLSNILIPESQLYFESECVRKSPIIMRRINASKSLKVFVLDIDMDDEECKSYVNKFYDI